MLGKHKKLLSHEVSKNLNQMLNEFNQKTKPISDVINKLDKNLNQ